MITTRPETQQNSTGSAVPCLVTDCSEPGDPQAAAYWAPRLATLTRDSVKRFEAEGGHTDLRGMCAWCAADHARAVWIFVRDEEAREPKDEQPDCGGHCSPYSNCVCQLMLDDGGSL